MVILKRPASLKSCHGSLFPKNALAWRPSSSGCGPASHLFPCATLVPGHTELLSQFPALSSVRPTAFCTSLLFHPPLILPLASSCSPLSLSHSTSSRKPPQITLDFSFLQGLNLLSIATVRPSGRNQKASLANIKTYLLLASLAALLILAGLVHLSGGSVAVG